VIDETEMIRRQMVAEINAEPGSRPDLESKHGQVWDTTELQDDFQVLGFAAPFVIVKRRSDGVRGSLDVPEQPTVLYYCFSPSRIALSRNDG